MSLLCLGRFLFSRLRCCLTRPSHGASAQLTDDHDVLELVNKSVSFLESELQAGRVIYGVNTGFGGSADTRTQHFERLQSAAIQHLNVGILLQNDKNDGSSHGGNELLRSHAFPSPIIKAAMLIRCNSLMRGHSGVRVDVIQAIMTLLAHDVTPVVPLRGSISASGDLSTLSYIAGAIEGNPDIFVRVKHANQIIPANEVLPMVGLQPVRLQAKEGLGITNGTAPSCAAACIVMHQANQLALLTQLLTAMGTEALAGTSHNYHPFISDIRPHSGQVEVSSNILKFLSGSLLSPDRGPEQIGLAQDRYALRTAPQWIGPQLEDLMLATRQVTVELNSTTDNPLIDVAGGRIHHGGNFQAAAITSAMEKTMVALQNLGRLLFAQSSELINNMTNKGLPPNLSADEPSGSFTFKGFDVNMAAYMAELAYLARPISTHVQVAEMTNQSVNSMALASARYALEAVEVLSLMAATYIYTLCQALDLRVVQLKFREAIRSVVTRHGGLYFSIDIDPEELLEVNKTMTEAISKRWDELSHLDTPDRSKQAVRDSMGVFLESLNPESQDLAFRRLPEYRTKVSMALEEEYNQIRQVFFREQSTAGYLSGATRVAYNFVRSELGVPFHRGVEDHPPLLLTTANGITNHVNGGTNCNGESNGNTNGLNKTGKEFSGRGKTLGSNAGRIYEALRSGALHDRIMKFGEEQGLWQ